MTYKNTLSTLAHQFRAHLALLLVGTLVLTTSCNDAKTDDKKAAAAAAAAAAEEEEEEAKIKTGILEVIVAEEAEVLAPRTVRSFLGKRIEEYRKDLLSEIGLTDITEKFTAAFKEGLEKALGLIRVTKKKILEKENKNAVANVDDAFAVAFVEHALAHSTLEYAMSRKVEIAGKEISIDLIKLGNSFVKLENNGEMTEEMVNFVKIHVKQKNGKFPIGKFTADDDSRASVKAVLELMKKLDSE